jgi:hypothetical protein
LAWIPGDGFWVLVLVTVRMLMPMLTPTLMSTDMEDNLNLSIAMIHRGYVLWQ